MKLKSFSRFTARAASVVLSMACVQAFAAPKLPEKAIGAETFVVINMDIAKVDPASVEAAANALLGAQAAMATEGLAKYKAKYQEYSSKMESLTLVMSGDPNAKEPEPVAYAKVKEGVDRDALLAQIKEEQAKNGKNAEDTVWSYEGDFLVMRKKGVEPQTADGERAAAFNALLSKSTKAMSVAFLPTTKIREKMKADAVANPPTEAWEKAAQQSISDMKNAVVDVGLGESPVVAANVEAANEADAKNLVDAVNQGAAKLKAQAAQMSAAGPQFAGIVAAMNGLADALKPASSGANVSMSLDGKVIAPVVANVLPMIMMGMGGGAGAPGRGPGGAGN